ncbi:unnamed protein product [Didymodactylos carnosus]|uniref:Uncharacterized protein n=1 Tax=Didymodactylos carnosus TaxID=1234261 RepID=A0A814Q1Y0_9BILA|nr:unnamed protein product [Didymodactylos carnosus]CAF3877423.1 unnamed protein product [Didymodactylos carnosus]
MTNFNHGSYIHPIDKSYDEIPNRAIDYEEVDETDTNQTGTIISTTRTSQQGNLELFTLIWLDAKVKTSKDNLNTQMQLKKVINFLKIFDNLLECEQYIRRVQNEKVVLIVSGRLGREIVPNIHDLPQLNSIYVYCLDKVSNQQWSNKYQKIIDVITQSEELISRLKKDQDDREQVEDLSSINIYDQTHKSLSNETGSFMWFQLFIEALIRMENKNADHEELAKLLRKNYDEHSVINEFESTYCSKKAVWWYTRDCCLYKLLNKALRVQDIDMLFHFRFLIADIFHQLKREHERFKKSIIHLYRGQRLSAGEVEKMKLSIGQCICMNSFFSTSLNRNTALQFIKSNVNSSMPSVLFDIEVNTRLKETKPFASTKHLSYYRREEEVLFMLGSVFRLETIKFDNIDNLWTIQLVLCSENGHEFNKVFDYMKSEMDKETDLLSLGHLLNKMGQFDKAKKYFYRVLDELNINISAQHSGKTDEKKKIPYDSDPRIPHCYHALGNIANSQGDYDVAEFLLKTALGLQSKSYNNNRISFAVTSSCMGSVYIRKNNFDLALEKFNQSLDIFSKTIGQDHTYTATVYANIGNIYRLQKKFDLAKQNLDKSLEIKLKILPDDHPDIAIAYTGIGALHSDKLEYRMALFNFKKALYIQQQSLPKYHKHIGKTYQSIGDAYYNSCQYEVALENLLQALTIFQRSLPVNHVYIKRVEEQIELVRGKLIKPECSYI